MKKSLIALAALAATASFAQSSVSISGLVDLGVNQIDFKGNKVTTTGAANGSATTAIVFAGTEDLGSGLKAEFRWEIDPDLGNTSNRTAGTSATGTTNNSTSFVGNGASFVGASGAFGAVKFGTPNSATLSINGEGNSGFATAIGSGYRVTSFDAVRFQNSLRYDTPDFNGFSASLLTSAKNDKQANGPQTGLSGNLNNQTQGRDQVDELGLAYANGPLSLRYAHLEMKQYAKVAQPSYYGGYYGMDWLAVDGAKFKLDSLSAAYKVMPTLSVAYFYQAVKSDSLVAQGVDATHNIASTARYDRKTNGISAAWDVAPQWTLRANYAVAKNGANHLAASATAAGGSAANANKSTKVLGLGADYALSKRTSVYARYERDSDDAGMRSITGYTAATGNTTYTATAVGIRHTF